MPATHTPDHAHDHTPDHHTPPAAAPFWVQLPAPSAGNCTQNTGGGRHGGHGGHEGHAELFRTRFWWSLLLTLPIVATSHMVMGWFGYDLDFPGMSWVGPVLGTIVYLWAGSPFLTGARDEVRARQPGMMLLVAMAVTVATGRPWRRAWAGSASTSGGSWPPWSPSCCWATGRR